MATYSLVHGSWHGGWTWDRVRAELERRGHVVHAPDLPCDDLSAGTAEYAACIPPADVVVGHSRGGLTISVVDAPRIYVCALVAGVSTEDAFVPGFGDACVRDELDRSYIVCTATLPSSRHGSVAPRPRSEPRSWSSTRGIPRC